MSNAPSRSLIEQLARLTIAFGIMFFLGLGVSVVIDGSRPTFADYWQVTGSFVVIVWSIAALAFVVARLFRIPRKDA